MQDIEKIIIKKKNIIQIFWNAGKLDWKVERKASIVERMNIERSFLCSRVTIGQLVQKGD